MAYGELILIRPGSIVDREYPPLSTVAKLTLHWVEEMKYSCSHLAGARRSDTWVLWVVLHPAALELQHHTQWHRRVGRRLAGNPGVKGADRRLLLLGQMALNLCGSKCAMSSETLLNILSLCRSQPTASKVAGEGEWWAKQLLLRGWQGSVARHC